MLLGLANIDNGGTISGGSGGDGGSGAGIVLSAGGSVRNSGIIAGGDGRPGYGGGVFGGPAGGGYGLILSGDGTVSNLGTITGGAPGSGTAGRGIGITGGGVVNNGGLAAGEALITGSIGVQTTGTAGVTVTNFGTIVSADGTNGTAVQFSNFNDILVLEGGGQLVGIAQGIGGTLDLDGGGGPGTLTGLGSHFTGFAKYEVLAGADWALTGSNSIANGAILTVSGTLVNAGTLLGGGQVFIAGFGALLDVQAGAVVTGSIRFSGPGGRLEIEGTANPGFTVSSFTRGDAIDLQSLAFDGSGTASLRPGNVLHVADAAGSLDLQLNPAEDFTGQSFTLTADSDGSTLVGVQAGGQFVFGPPGPAFRFATLGINDGTRPVFPTPDVRHDVFNIEVFTFASLGNALPTLDANFVAGVILRGGFIGSNPANYLVGGQLQLFAGDYMVADAPNGSNIPARIILGSGNQTVVGAAGDTLVGGSGSQVLFGADGGWITAGTNRTYVEGEVGGMRIAVGPSGAVDVIGSTVTGNGDTIIGGSGNLNYNPGRNGGHDLIDLSGSSGSATINAFSTNGAQFTRVDDTVIAGTGSSFVGG